VYLGGTSPASANVEAVWHARQLLHCACPRLPASLLAFAPGGPLDATPSIDPATTVLQLVATLALTFVIGLEREERVARDRTLVGGVRTIPIIGLLGHAMALLSRASALPLAAGFLALVALLAVEYHHRLMQHPQGATSEAAVLAAYLVGALVGSGQLVSATAITVAILLLLTAKDPLERFALRIPPREITTFVSFLLIVGVILPVLPDQGYTPFDLNPRHTWLVVVAVSALSYASYVTQTLVQARESVLLTALLGGAYSSTATTLVLARRSREQPDVSTYAGAIVLASGVMYVRLNVLVLLFAPALGVALAPRLLGLAVGAGAAGGLAFYLGSRADDSDRSGKGAELRHPLEIGSALLFAVLFLVLSILTRWVAAHLGAVGVRVLAAVVGTTDIDPFVLSLATGASAALPHDVTGGAILLAAASNDLAKAGYALVFGDRRVGRVACLGLLVLAGLTAALAFR
jgi:uncharacterized membrane protein (DUF4010 family)